MSIATLDTKCIGLQLTVRRGLATCGICVLAAVAMMSEPVARVLQFDRGAIADGQWWRVITGHLVHWNVNHFVWDALMFAILGVLCECRSRRRYVLCLVVSALAISASVYWRLPEMTAYRGLSGIDSALFTLAVVLLWRDARRDGDCLMAGMLIAGMVGLVGKLAYEIATGATLFVDSSSAGFVPLPLVHAVGAGVGLLGATRVGRSRFTVARK